MEAPILEKKYKISSEQLRDILPNQGSCYATDMITVDGEKVGYMYREEPEDKFDSGWRIFSGKETQEYADDPKNLAIYKLNTIANYDSSIIPYLNMPIGTTLERKEDTDTFIIVEELKQKE